MTGFEVDKERLSLLNIQNPIKTERTEEDYIEMLTSYFISTTNDSYLRMTRGDISKEEFLKMVTGYLDKIAKDKSKVFKENILNQFEKELWGFGVLEELIDDSPNDEETISDIKVVTFDNVRIKKNGKRMDGGVKFSSEKAFWRFVRSIAARNGQNLSMLNAKKTFTDTMSNKDWILRFSIVTEFINSTAAGQPALHIRKLPKKHKSLSYYESRGKLVTKEQMAYFKKRIEDGYGFLIIGKTGAGKTIFFNGLLDYVPRDKSVLCVQEYEELNNACDDADYVPHPEMLFFHTVSASGEGKVEYDLKDISQIGLTFDIDYFALGETKGAEAKYLLNYIKTGSIGMASGHGSSIEDGMDKIADYITYESSYTKAEALAELQRLNTVVFIKDFRVQDVAEVTGYDREKQTLIYNHVELS